jgi:hypothetical protein
MPRRANLPPKPLDDVKSCYFSLTHHVGSDALLAPPLSAFALGQRYRGWPARCHVFGDPSSPRACHS